LTITASDSPLQAGVAPRIGSGAKLLSFASELRHLVSMDTLTLFGLFAVSAMLVCYAFEDRSPWFVLAFAAACALGSAYGFLQGAWPFGLVEAVWAMVALRRWLKVRRS
jgi:hypothetical protein